MENILPEPSPGRRIRLAARAKINLFLEVLEKRPDAYHNLESVFTEITWADDVQLERLPKIEISIACDDPALTPGKENLLYKAAEAMGKRYGWRSGLAFVLRKSIPIGGGLGGGSSDAAAALRLINELWSVGATREELVELAAGIGSDVTFFLYGGACLCRGRGEVVQPLSENAHSQLRLGLAIPGLFSGTAAAFRGLRLPKRGEARNAAAFVAAWAAGDWRGMEREAFNRFEATVFENIPDLGRIQAALAEKLARPVRLSGSGSTLWFFLRQHEEDISQDWQEFAAGQGVVLRSVRSLGSYSQDNF